MYAYSNTLSSFVHIVSQTTLWGHIQADVYAPSLGRFLTLPADDLIPLADAPAPALDQLIVTIAAARIRAALAEGALLAPLTANVTPLPHQIAALQRALADPRKRLLLADEVGLGKTIEAGLIQRELKLRGLVQRTLVIAPTGLTGQWQQELLTHFGETFQLLAPADFPTLRRQPGDANLWRRHHQVICPLDSVKPIDARRGWSAEHVTRYNAERFDDLVSAGWDLVIFDEAHRLAGSAEHVARYQLARGLADATPFVLLLSATPHNGKTDAFRRLLSLLDRQTFPALASVDRERVAPYIIRTPKRAATDAQGAPLFRPRQTRMLAIAWSARHSHQQALYDAVSDYVRSGYNAARRDRRQAIGFLLVLMQRLVSSSTRAIREALERRLDVLTDQTPMAIAADITRLDDAWADLDGEAQLGLVLTQVQALRGERHEVETLLALARRCEAAGLDARAEALLDLIYQVQQDANNPAQKLLIFTEFTATQRMLQLFLESRGFNVATLNGSMARDDREAAQHTFAHDAQILISTDAGGEGLNLQFCNVVVNYDLPWNPMRIEQRIGRVDRIGQQQVVRAINMLLAESVEARVHEVLMHKLATILGEFGVDKASDVLDSAESEQAVERLYLDALLDPATFEQHVDVFVGGVRQRATEIREERALYTSDVATIHDDGQDLARTFSTHPLPAWLARMTIAAALAEGGVVRPRLGGYDITWADGTAWNDVTFDRQHADAVGSRLLTLEEPRLRAYLERRIPWVLGQPIPVVAIAGLPSGISGVWGLWEVAAIPPDDQRGTTVVASRSSTILPLFRHDDGRVLDPSARWIWDALLRATTTLTVVQVLGGDDAEHAFQQQQTVAQQRGAAHYATLTAQLHHYTEQEQQRGAEAYTARRAAIERIGLPNVRRVRLAELDDEQSAWQGAMLQRRRVQPSLQALLLMKVVQQ